MAKTDKTIELTLNPEQTRVVVDAIRERVSALDKLGSNLLKAKQAEASKPIFDQAKRLNEVIGAIFAQTGGENGAGEGEKKDGK